MARDTEVTTFFMQVYIGIMKDAALAWPDYKPEFLRDQRRIVRIVRERGLATLMVDFPALAKQLDRSLSRGQYELAGITLERAVSATVRVPRLFRALYLLIFDISGRLKENYDVEAVYFLRQILLLAKKFERACSVEDTQTEVCAFVDVEDLLPSPHLVWTEAKSTPEELAKFGGGGGFARGCQLNVDAPSYGVDDGTSYRFLEALDFVAGALATTLGPYDPDEWQFRHGPGAVSDQRGTFNKYRFSQWDDRLDAAFPYSSCGVHNFAAWAGDMTLPSEAESPSRMIAVPKTLKKPRLIAAESSERVWCQQNMRDYMYSMFEKTWIGDFVRLKDRRMNQEMARRASEHGLFATVDLSAASDRVTCDVVANLFRANPKVLHALHACRTRSIEIAPELLGSTSAKILSLKKFSTMGSAVTFPVETLWFLCATLAACLVSRRLPFSMKSIRSLVGRVAVYGDDIVVPVDSVNLLLRGLELTYSKPNADKTFTVGNFRESCGLDVMDGVDVSPIYIRKVPDKTKPASIASCVDTRNGFYERKFLLHVVATIDQHLDEMGFPIPSKAIDSGSFGLTSYVFPLSSEPNKGRRWNGKLQRYEVRTLNFTSKSELHPIGDDSALLQWFTEAPGPTTKWESGWRGRPATKYRSGWAACQDLEVPPGGRSHKPTGETVCGRFWAGVLLHSK